MVVLGSGAMVIFGLGPVFDTLSRPPRGGGSSENRVIAEWNDGEITRDDLRLMQVNHFRTQQFLEALQLTAMKEKGDDFRPLAARIPPIQQDQQTQQYDVDQQLIERMVLARKAELEGVIASDGVVDNYLAMVSGDVGFTENDMARINEKANQGSCSLGNIRQHLRLELLAQQMRMLMQAGIPVIPNPLEAIQYHAMVAEKVECDVLPISVDNYLSKTGEPEILELKKIYEEGRFNYPFPDNEKPGFKQRNKVALGVLEGRWRNVHPERDEQTDRRRSAEGI